MVSDLSAKLAKFEGAGYVVAPAGYGKTHLIASATSISQGRQLVLTHTYAGVHALRKKMREQNVNGGLFHVDTVASWSLRLCLAYPGMSGWGGQQPADNAEWNDLYDACSRLLSLDFVHKIIGASYAGVYVDEYQDCSVRQNRLVRKLARLLPCRILGDPMQGIFNFAGQDSINWGRDVEADLVCLGELSTPYRWLNAGVPELGDWLRDVRSNLEIGRDIDLRGPLPHAVTVIFSDQDPRKLIQKQSNACRYFNCERSQSVIAVHAGRQQFKAKCHRLSKNLSGRYSSIEEVEGKHLFSFIRNIDEAVSCEKKLEALLDFARLTMNGVNVALPAATARYQKVAINANTRNPEAARIANAFLSEPNSENLSRLLKALRSIEGVVVTRADLFNRALGVCRRHLLRPDHTLKEAADEYQLEFRYQGRPLTHKRLIGTTLLVKGLEYDHAIVLDAVSLSKKELYVALTRGARSLTIITTKQVLSPPD